MKTRKLFTLLLLGAGVLFMSSCKDDEGDPSVLGPALDVEEVNTGSMGGEITIEEGSSLKFAIDARKGDNDLETFRISTTGVNSVSDIPTSYDDHSFPYEIENADDETYVDTVEFANAGTALGTTTYTFTVEDNLGNSRSVTFDVTVEEPETMTPLSDPQPFEWTRMGSDEGVGLDQFGLEWTANTTTNAIVKKDEATRFVMLEESDWVDITTVEELGNAIESAPDMEEYDNVSVTDTGDYNDVLGVRYDGDYYMLRIDHAEVTFTGQTNVTITGNYKE